MIWEADPFPHVHPDTASAIKKMVKQVAATIPEWPYQPHQFSGGPKNGHLLVPNDVADVILKDVCGFYARDEHGRRMTHIYCRMLMDCGKHYGFVYHGRSR